MAKNSRKRDLGVFIGFILLDQGYSLDEARDEVKKIQRKSISEMETIYNEMKAEVQGND